MRIIVEIGKNLNMKKKGLHINTIQHNKSLAPPVWILCQNINQSGIRLLLKLHNRTIDPVTKEPVANEVPFIPVIVSIKCRFSL